MLDLVNLIFLLMHFVYCLWFIIFHCGKKNVQCFSERKILFWHTLTISISEVRNNQIIFSIKLIDKNKKNRHKLQATINHDIKAFLDIMKLTWVVTSIKKFAPEHVNNWIIGVIKSDLMYNVHIIFAFLVMHIHAFTFICEIDYEFVTKSCSMSFDSFTQIYFVSIHCQFMLILN